MSPQERAEQIDREEREAERADLMRRALAYAAQKRAEERARALGVQLATDTPSTGCKPGRKASVHEHRGEHRTLAGHADRYGIRYQLLISRLSKGWTLAAALETPLRASLARNVPSNPIHLDRPAEGQTDRLDLDQTPGCLPI